MISDARKNSPHSKRKYELRWSLLSAPPADLIEGARRLGPTRTRIPRGDCTRNQKDPLRNSGAADDGRRVHTGLPCRAVGIQPCPPTNRANSPESNRSTWTTAPHGMTVDSDAGRVDV